MISYISMPIVTRSGETHFIKIDFENKMLYVKQSNGLFHIVEDLHEVVEVDGDMEYECEDEACLECVKEEPREIIKKCRDEIEKLPNSQTFERAYFEQIISSMMQEMEIVE